MVFIGIGVKIHFKCKTVLIFSIIHVSCTVEINEVSDFIHGTTIFHYKVFNFDRAA